MNKLFVTLLLSLSLCGMNNTKQRAHDQLEQTSVDEKSALFKSVSLEADTEHVCCCNAMVFFFKNYVEDEEINTNLPTSKQSQTDITNEWRELKQNGLEFGSPLTPKELKKLANSKTDSILERYDTISHENLTLGID